MVNVKYALAGAVLYLGTILGCGTNPKVLTTAAREEPAPVLYSESHAPFPPQPMLSQIYLGDLTAALRYDGDGNGLSPIEFGVFLVDQFCIRQAGEICRKTPRFRDLFEHKPTYFGLEEQAESELAARSLYGILLESAVSTFQNVDINKDGRIDRRDDIDKDNRLTDLDRRVFEEIK